MASQDLANRGISADLAVHYAKAGWLVRLAHGVYSRPGDSLALHPCLRFLERNAPGLPCWWKDRAGLVWHTAIRFAATDHPSLWLECVETSGGGSRNNFPPTTTENGLFKEEPSAPLYTTSFERKSDAPQVSEPERALLEVLSDVGVRQPLQEARELTQGTHTLRANVLMELFALMREYQDSAFVPKSRQGTQVTLVIQTRSHRVAAG